MKTISQLQPIDKPREKLSKKGAGALKNYELLAIMLGCGTKDREKDKKALIDRAHKTIKMPSQIWAFGSRVTGEAHDTSDLDLVIVTPEDQKITSEEFLNFTDQLTDSNIPILIQVLDWHKIPESFHHNILRHYEEVVTIDA
jgi:predicted nucleotidyltransferase